MNAFFVEKLLATLLVAAVSVLADPLKFFWQNKDRVENSKDSSDEDDEDDDDKDYLKYIYVVIGVIGAFLLLFIVFYCLCKSRKKKNTILATVRKSSAENNPIKPSAPSQLYSIANNSYTGPVRGGSVSSGNSEHSYQNVVYENNYRDTGHMGMGPPPPYFEHEGRAPEYTPSVVTLADTHNSKSKQ